MSEDPERQRVEDLAGAALRGQASAAEREELAIYAEGEDDLAKRAKQSQRLEGVGEGWLERVEADRRIQAKERSTGVMLERKIGLGLFFAGIISSIPLPILGLPILSLGALILAWSVFRVRAQTWRDDPYKDVHQ